MNNKYNLDYTEKISGKFSYNKLFHVAADSIANIDTFLTKEIAETLNINISHIKNNVHQRLRNMAKGKPVNELENYMCELLYNAGRFIHLIITHKKINANNLSKNFANVRDDIAKVISEKNNQYNTGWIKEI